jgi:hypothetical protein
MRERSAADNFSLRAFPALLADSERSFADKLAARALPPNFPRATAFGFFLALILTDDARRYVRCQGKSRNNYKNLIRQCRICAPVHCVRRFAHHAASLGLSHSKRT